MEQERGRRPRVAPGRVVGDHARDLAAVEQVRRSARRRRAGSPRRRRTHWARNHPETAWLEEADLGLVDDLVGDVAAGRRLSRYLVTDARRTLSEARDAGAELDDVVVEERHPDLERVRHRRAVEVVEHVVHQAELRVEVEASSGGPGRRRPPRVRRACAAPRRRRGRPRAPRARLARSAGAHVAVHREVAVDRVAAGERPAQPPQLLRAARAARPRPGRRAGAGGPTTRRRSPRRGACGSRPGARRPPARRGRP